MKAAYVDKLIGEPSKLVVGDQPRPHVGPGQMVVRSRAAGVNPVDWKMLSPMFGQSTSLPIIPGFEVAGVVEAAGPGAGFHTGDEVIACTNFSGGGFAQYVAVDPRSAALKPRGMSFEEAAAGDRKSVV